MWYNNQPEEVPEHLIYPRSKMTQEQKVERLSYLYSIFPDILEACDIAFNDKKVVRTEILRLQHDLRGTEYRINIDTGLIIGAED